MQEELFTVGGLDRYVPADHPLRRVREVFNGCLARMDTHFDGLYSAFGRESIPPEKLLRALMLQVLFGIRSRAPVGRAVALQHALSLVCWPALA